MVAKISLITEGGISLKKGFGGSTFKYTKLNEENYVEYFKETVEYIKDIYGVIEVNVFLEEAVSPRQAPRDWIFQVFLKCPCLHPGQIQFLVDASELNDVDAEMEIRALKIKAEYTLYEVRFIHSHWAYLEEES